MVKIVKEADLPFSAKELFNAVADYEKFPKVFPSIRTTTVLQTQNGATDLDMVFNVPPAIAAFLPAPSQQVRATMVPDKEIDIQNLGGALKEMHIHWTFNEVAPGKTHVKFEMDYETGMNAAVSATVKIFIGRNTKDVLENLEGFVKKNKPKAP